MSDFDDEDEGGRKGWLHPDRCDLPRPPSGWRSDLGPEARLSLWYLGPRYAKGYQIVLEQIERAIARRIPMDSIKDPRGPWEVKLFTRGETFSFEAIFLCDGVEVERATFHPRS